MTEHRRLARTRSLLSASAAITVLALAATGCSRADEDASPAPQGAGSSASSSADGASASASADGASASASPAAPSAAAPASTPAPPAATTAPADAAPAAKDSKDSGSKHGAQKHPETGHDGRDAKGSSGAKHDHGTSGAGSPSSRTGSSDTTSKPGAAGKAGGAGEAESTRGAGAPAASAPASAPASGAPAPAAPAPAATDLSAVQAPSSWKGTVVTAPDATRDGGVFYQGMDMLHTEDGMIMGTVTAAMIEDSEVAGGITGPDGTDYMLDSCTGRARVGTKDAVRCTLTSENGRELHAYIRATSTAYGQTGLLLRYAPTAKEATFALPGSRAMAVGSARADSHSPSQVDAAEAEGLIKEAVLTQYMHEGDDSPLPKATCEVRDGGEHLMCRVTGSPKGGKGDGTWYGTHQPGGDARVLYVFSRLPQG